MKNLSPRKIAAVLEKTSPGDRHFTPIPVRTQIAFWAWFLSSLTYGSHAWAHHCGFFRWLAELQLRHAGGYDVNLTLLATDLLALTVSAPIMLTAKWLIRIGRISEGED